MVAGVVLGLVGRAWLATLRLTVVADPRLDPSDPRPWVLVFWHGQQFALLAWPRRRRTVALVSWSSDGQIQTSVLRLLGLVVERGSSSRGGAAGLRALTRRVQQGCDAAFAVDGPRGPLHRVAPGARLAAVQTEGLVIPMASASERGHTFERAWDRYRLPWPFSRAVVALGAPLDPAHVTDVEIGEAIAAVSRRANAEIELGSGD
jgi:lysophospholipid acyltransferase (LPLAT)-like uncharacterized protein